MNTKMTESATQSKTRTIGIIIGIFALGGGVLLASSHGHKETTTVAEATTQPVADVVKISRENLANEMSIPAEFRPYEEVELHSKVSGYLKSIHVDIGDKVKAGQLIATLEVPELQAELRNAVAAEVKAQVTYTNAHLIYTRLTAVNGEHPNLVAQQELDTATANDQEASAAMAEATAEAEKYKTLIGYTQITAPFDGVVTRRTADPGALIQAGTSSDTQSRPLVRISNNYRLRLDFPVSVDYVKDLRTGSSVNVRVDSLNGKTFSSVVTRDSGSVDETTRTMIAEVETPNPDLELVPGMYATITMKIQERPQVLAIPVEAVKGDKVFVVNANHELEERQIKLGLETPDKYEVLSGLNEGDLVVVGKSASLHAGEKIEPKVIELSMTSGL